MLTKEQNDRFTQVGPGTPMGNMFRCYWMPALLSEELPENDCPPVRIKLLGERLLAFRDSEGKLGLIDEFGSSGSVARDVIKAERIVDFTPRDYSVEGLLKRSGASALSALLNEQTMKTW